MNKIWFRNSHTYPTTTRITIPADQNTIGAAFFILSERRELAPGTGSATPQPGVRLELRRSFRLAACSGFSSRVRFAFLVCVEMNFEQNLELLGIVSFKRL